MSPGPTDSHPAAGRYARTRMRASRTRRRTAAIGVASAVVSAFFGQALAAPIDMAAVPDTGPMGEGDAWGAEEAVGADLGGPALVPFLPGEANVEELPSAVRYTGRLVAQRSLVAPAGGLPDDSLEPLLRVQQDTVYNPQAVRQDIAMLHRVLDFAQVEVDVEDWVAFGPDGAPIPAVKVEYRVYPPPRLAKVRFTAARGVSRRTLLDAIGREEGEPFFPEESTRVREAVEAAYAAAGYPRAVATVTAEVDGNQRVTLVVAVKPGEPDRIVEVRIRSGAAISEVQARWILARAGLSEGRPWTEVALRDAREALLEALRRRGYYEARATLQVDAQKVGEGRLVVLIDPRRRWRVEVVGRGLPNEQAVVEALGLAGGARISRRFEEEAARALTERLRAEARLAAKVAVRVRETDASVTVQVTGEAGPRYRLGDAEWVGAPVYTDRYLTGALAEASPDRIGRGRISEAAVDAALEVLQEFYRSEGYLSARLSRETFRPRAVAASRRAVPVDVRVRVEAGPRAVLRGVNVEGDVGDVDGNAFFEDLVGQPLNPSEVEVRLRRVVEVLNERGHLAADARASTTVSADGERADVTVEVTAGPVVYLRSVLLRGHKRTRRAVIEREVDVTPGDPLAPSRLAAIRRRLYELDLFSRVSAELVGDEDRAKDLVVEVEERPNLHVELGGGVATDQGVRVFARGGHRNLFGLGHRFTLVGQAGLGWVGDGWTLDWVTPEWKAAARYEAPNIPGRGERVAFDVLFNEQEQEPSFRLERSGAGVGALLRIGDKGTAELAYRVQLRRLLDVDPGAVVPGDPWLDELSLDDLADPSPVLPSATRAQSGLDLSFVLDLRDDAFNPTRGGIGSVFVTLTDEVLSDLTFVRGEASWAWWVPIGGVGLQGRLRAGAAWVPDAGRTLPLEERFRLGGGANLRGFQLDSVGPANEVSREAIPFGDALGPIVAYGGRDEVSRWVATGGDAMALGSLELRVPFEKLGLQRWAGTQLGIFADVGNVWFIEEGSADSQVDDPLLRWSVGLGLRRATVIGPIQVDVGFNPAPLRDEPWAQLHVTLGAL